jgi:hypothetical protein
VQTPDDEQFEAYLKRFHPIAPEPVPTLSVSHSSRHSLSLGTWLAAVAAILVVIGAVILHIRSNRVVVSNTAGDAAMAERHAPSEPLTMRSANAWLATAPSFKAAVDDLAFRSQTSPLPQGKQSAVAVLSKEKIRL